MARRPRELRFFTLFLLYWLPVLGYITLIITLSAQPNLQPPINFNYADKFYHALEYSILGFLLARAVRAGFRISSLAVASLVALSLGIVVATSDEVFQSTVPGRSCDAFDLMADTVGLSLAQLVHRVFARD